MTPYCCFQLESLIRPILNRLVEQFPVSTFNWERLTPFYALLKSQFKIIVFLSCASVAFPYQTESPPYPIRVGEGVLRKKATNVVRPAFPDVAFKKEVTGVVVAWIETDEQGDMVSVTILQSPNKEIGSAVKKALARWRFAPTTLKGKPVGVAGKLTFYYEIENGVGLVLSPDEKRALRALRPVIATGRCPGSGHPAGSECSTPGYRRPTRAHGSPARIVRGIHPKARHPEEQA